MQIAGGGGRTYSVADVAATLETINVDPETIEAIVRILRMSSDKIAGRSFDEIPATSFGNSPAGGHLGHHTSLAHQKLAQAMGQMMDDLTRTSQDVVDYQRSQQFNDDMTRESLERLAEVVRGIPRMVF